MITDLLDSYNKRLAQIRDIMQEKQIDAFIIPITDPHMGEYIPDHWRIIEWLTGFSGSAATVVITKAFAGLWTDSRYFIQAENQLVGSGYLFMNPLLTDKLGYLDWIEDNLLSCSKIGLDGRTLSIASMREIEKRLKNKNITFDISFDPVSPLWTDRPGMPDSVAFDHSVVFSGKERATKIKELREEMKRVHIQYHLITSVDDIMWLLNIRGNDVKYSPLLTSFALVGEDQLLLFADESKIPYKMASEFDTHDIVILPYEETGELLKTLSAGSTVQITPGTTSVELFNSIQPGVNIIEGTSIPSRMKAIKNVVEIENINKVMIKDGVALTKFFYWLEEESDSECPSEISLGEKLNYFKAEQENYMGSSFSPIVAYNDHGALPHYSATPLTNYQIGKDGLLLIDSGGQYLDGTTDITRTIARGIPTVQQKKDFTLVLKGTISLSLARFPYGTRGYQLDLLAREALWRHGMNYGHGTGHGVGFFLNVHEGPQNISHVAGKGSKTVLEEGMIISDEPGIYREGGYGIRTENLILCMKDKETEFGKFLKFDTVSLCYIDKTLIDNSLLDIREVDWLNSYHATVFEKLSPFLAEKEKLWLKEKTKGL